jgi:hypothetical protein
MPSSPSRVHRKTLSRKSSGCWLRPRRIPWTGDSAYGLAEKASEEGDVGARAEDGSPGVGQVDHRPARPRAFADGSSGRDPSRRLPRQVRVLRDHGERAAQVRPHRPRQRSGRGAHRALQGLKLLWDRGVAIRGIEREDEEVRRLKAEISSQKGSTYFARMQYGRLLDAALQARSERYVNEIFAQLRDVSVASRANQPIGDKVNLRGGRRHRPR